MRMTTCWMPLEPVGNLAGAASATRRAKNSEAVIAKPEDASFRIVRRVSMRRTMSAADGRYGDISVILPLRTCARARLRMSRKPLSEILLSLVDVWTMWVEFALSTHRICAFWLVS
jgi:hypothetical protein